MVIESNGSVRVGEKVRLATWNCGGLSFTQSELCSELGYDVLGLTETHDKGSLSTNRCFIKGDAAPKEDAYAGVALLLSDRMDKCVINSGSRGARIVFARFRVAPCNLFVVGVCVCVCSTQWQAQPLSRRHVNIGGRYT